MVAFSSVLSSWLSCSLLSRDTSEPVTPTETVSEAFDNAIARLIIKYFFAENIEGAGQDSLLCLKRGRGTWGDWDDYDELVPKLAKAAETVSGQTEMGKLKVQVFFAESDRMIEKKGAAWFDACWVEERRGLRINYESPTIAGTNHESICNSEYGAVESVMKEAAMSLCTE